ncbi:hypothetical protein CKAN_01263400 [Cinnamomum micranthum f. kanehirae]|uniref:Uncharacterized protein n=1 Tax=Cinnamomum micranthum f. kanehirae TaxID=337451 RepID=A0A443NZA1_9MAGN|nr:hypothetical protein CKAN_01263400 [Cinnamomum micranthum f. kanehirae]
MDWKISEKKDQDVDADGGDGVFVKRKMLFLIRDDLQISVVSSSTFFALLGELGISDVSVLEERNVTVGEEEQQHVQNTIFGTLVQWSFDVFPRIQQLPTQVLHLLQHLLLSKTLLTDVFLGEPNTTNGVDVDLKVIASDSHEMVQSQTEQEISSDSRKIIVKLFLTKSNNKLKCLDGCTIMGCLENLYKSVGDISFKDCMKYEECKAMLLDPKLASYFGTKNQLLQIEEQVQCKPDFFHCITCYDDDSAYITGP